MQRLPFKEIVKKYSVLICVLVSVFLILVAALIYPGGSLADKNSIGFDWTKNFISNLFASKAINGLDNPSRIWAITGMAFHSVGYGLFFIHMSKKIPSGHAVTVLKTIGLANIIFNFLITTSVHDIMVTISSTLSMLGLFYITVFILKTKLHLVKLGCIICLLTFYYTLFLYGSGNWGRLAIMQKISFMASMFLILGLEYFIKKKHFNQIIKEEIKITSDK